MDTEVNFKHLNIGRKIERIRKLRGLTQEAIGIGLGITKQAVSKLEQSETIEDDRLKQIADVLGVTLEGLKAFKEESVLYNTNNFYENNTFNGSAVAAHIDNSHIHNPLEKIIELYENLLKVEREKVEILLNKKGE
jgi:transcriptional regulator with XRE-family HTH domain